jgi:endogenous inhibitor of DNA gyrase (YacG/DUF329 family)
MIDLGAWATEAYRVPVEAPSDEDEIPAPAPGTPPHRET